jgi:hypothetical protein
VSVTTSIPLWVPLVVAILGLIGTGGGAIAGVIITQRRSDARDRAAWDRERERWAREDAARTYELRREAYIEFHAAVNRQRAVFIDVQRVRHEGFVEPDQSTSDEMERDLRRTQEKVRIYGSPAVVEAAEYIVTRLMAARSTLKDEERTARHLSAFARKEAELLREIRADLGIPVDNIEKAEG